VGALFTLAIMRRTRRGGALVHGLAGMSLGAVAICAGPLVGGYGLALSILGFGVAGAAATLVSTGTTAIVDARHGAASGSVLSAIHGTGAIAGLLAPAAIGATIAIGLTWRVGLLVHVPLALVGIVLILRSWHDPFLRDGPPPAVVAHPSNPRGRAEPMPLRFWAVLAVLMVGVSLEFAFTVWSGALLQERTPLTTAGSTAAVSGVLVGMASGRLLLARLARGMAPRAVLSTSAGVVTVGWAVLWVATLPPVGSAELAIAGLVLSGLGIGAFFPIGLAWLVKQSLGRPEAATARLNIGGGVASGVMPFALGFLADRIGVHLAFLLVPGVIVVAVVVLAGLRERAD